MVFTPVNIEGLVDDWQYRGFLSVNAILVNKLFEAGERKHSMSSSKFHTKFPLFNGSTGLPLSSCTLQWPQTLPSRSCLNCLFGKA